MPCPRDKAPYGYAIQHSNSEDNPCWLVMRWGWILEVCCTLEEAVAWLQGELTEGTCDSDT